MSEKERVGFFLNVVAIFILSYCPLSQADSHIVENRIRSPLKRIDIVEKYASIEGPWKIRQGTSNRPMTPTINTVHVGCDKISMTCRETIATLWTDQGGPSLFITENTYRIIDWSDYTICAKCSTPVADIDLKISFKDQVAEKRMRETKARGSETSDPNIFEYYTLE